MGYSKCGKICNRYVYGLIMSIDCRAWDTVDRILESKKQLACACTGGGSTLLNWLFNHPGASRLLVEAQVPYSARSLEKFLGKPGPHPVNTYTARDMAFVAYTRAMELGDESLPAIGLALTAALTTNRSRKGKDRACVALMSDDICRIWTLNLGAEAVDRCDQEAIVTSFSLGQLATLVGVEFDPKLPEWVETDYQFIDLKKPLKALYEGKVDALKMGVDGKFSVSVSGSHHVFLPGSFNPLHEGHIQLAKTVEALSGREVNLEMAIQNVDKADITLPDLKQRLSDLQGYFPVILTRCPRFLDKAQLFIGPHFVVGYDTAERLVDSRYYGNSDVRMQESLERLQRDGTIIWVAGRLVNDCFKTLNDITLPEGLEDLFKSVTQDQFRIDISSTQIRSTNSLDR